MAATLLGDALEHVLLKFRLRWRRRQRLRGNRTAIFAAEQMTTRQKVIRVRRRRDLVNQFAFAPRRQAPLIELAQQHQRVGFTEREPIHQHCRDIECRVVPAWPLIAGRHLAMYRRARSNGEIFIRLSP